MLSQLSSELISPLIIIRLFNYLPLLSNKSIDEAVVRIEKLLTLMPDWVEKVAWARPHLRFKGDGADRPLKEVIDEAKAKAAKDFL